MARRVLHRDDAVLGSTHEGALNAALHAVLVRVPEGVGQRHARDAAVNLPRRESKQASRHRVQPRRWGMWRVRLCSCTLHANVSLDVFTMPELMTCKVVV